MLGMNPRYPLNKNSGYLMKLGHHSYIKRNFTSAAGIIKEPQLNSHTKNIITSLYKWAGTV
jgi:hypothetical protein